MKTLTYLYQHFCTFCLNAKINNNNKLITHNGVFEWDNQIINESLCYAKSPYRLYKMQYYIQEKEE